VLKWI